MSKLIHIRHQSYISIQANHVHGNRGALRDKVLWQQWHMELDKSIHIYNEGAGSAVVTIKITSGGVDYFYDKQTIAADAQHEFIVNILILEEDDILKMLSDITGPDITISILETSREDR